MKLLTCEEIDRMTEEEFRDWQKKVTINNICRMLYRLDDKYLRTVEVFVRSLYGKLLFVRK